jgi:hypothetical protein
MLNQCPCYSAGSGSSRLNSFTCPFGFASRLASGDPVPGVPPGGVAVIVPPDADVLVFL